LHDLSFGFLLVFVGNTQQTLLIQTFFGGVPYNLKVGQKATQKDNVWVDVNFARIMQQFMMRKNPTQTFV
jgi:hypothetical protein